MLQALRKKFVQPALREILLGTAGRELVEASPGDSFWGSGRDGSGSNRLGHLLMRLREELISQG